MSVGDAKAERAVEIGKAKPSDTIYGIGRDVRRVDGANRDRHPQAAGKSRPASHAVTSRAVAKFGEVFSASKQPRTWLGRCKIAFSGRPVRQIRNSDDAQQAANASNYNDRNCGSPSHAGTKGPGDLR